MINFYSVLSRLEKLIFIGAAILAAISATALAALFIANHTVVVAARGGSLREGLTDQPSFINPIIPLTSADREISQIVFSSLKDISESIKASDLGRVWTVRLKERVLWHDKEPLTSDDVIFTLNTVLNKDAHSPLYQSFQGVSAERVSQLEIKFTLQAPYAFFAEEHLSKLLVIPKHIFGDLPAQNFRLSIYGLRPVGTGPYEVNSYKQDEKGFINSLHLKANKNYFNGAPNISDLYFQFYKNEQELIGAYNSAEITSFLLSSSAELHNLGDAESVIKVQHRIYDISSSRYYAVFINQALSNKALKDIKARRALSETIDRNALISGIFGSHVKPIYGPTLHAVEPENTGDLSALKDLSLSLTIPDEDFIVKTANILKTQWENAGATVNVISLPLKDLEEKVLKNTDYSMILFGNTTGVSNDLFSFWHSSQRFYPDQNLALYQNKKVDSLLESYRKDFDSDTRSATLKTIGDSIAADYPAIFLYSPDYLYIATPRLHGFDGAMTIGSSADRFQGIEKWYVNTKRVWSSK